MYKKSTPDDSHMTIVFQTIHLLKTFTLCSVHAALSQEGKTKIIRFETREAV
jgi:hypothetical protein